MASTQTLSVIPENTLVNKIREILDLKVMLDRYLAELYGIEMKVLNQALKNI